MLGAVAGGDLSKHAPVAGNDELTVLATALNQAQAAADEAQAEQVRARFIGNGPQYTPQSVSFYGN